MLAIGRRIHELRSTGNPVWAEVIYDGAALSGNLMGEVAGMTEGTNIEVLRVKDTRLVSEALSSYQSCEELTELTETEVFERCMETSEIPPEQKDRLMTAFLEVLNGLDAAGPDGGKQA